MGCQSNSTFLPSKCDHIPNHVHMWADPRRHCIKLMCVNYYDRNTRTILRDIGNGTKSDVPPIYQSNNLMDSATVQLHFAVDIVDTAISLIFILFLLTSKAKYLLISQD